MLPSAIVGLRPRKMVELFLMSLMPPPEAMLCEGEEGNFELVGEHLPVHWVSLGHHQHLNSHRLLVVSEHLSNIQFTRIYKGRE